MQQHRQGQERRQLQRPQERMYATCLCMGTNTSNSWMTGSIHRFLQGVAAANGHRALILGRVVLIASSSTFRLSYPAGVTVNEAKNFGFRA